MRVKRKLGTILILGAVSGLAHLSAIAEDKTGFKEGATMVALVNLHPDSNRKRLYAINYQLPSLVPMCSKVVIEDIGKKEIEFSYEGVTYSYLWDKHTKNAGESLAENFKHFFGQKCDQAKVATLSEVDQAGVKSGIPKVGMSKEGILFAMGRPPIHATPSLESNTWMYWLNKWKRQAIEFDEKGKVKEVRL